MRLAAQFGIVQLDDRSNVSPSSYFDSSSTQSGPSQEMPRQVEIPRDPKRCLFVATRERALNLYLILHIFAKVNMKWQQECKKEMKESESNIDCSF